MRKPARQGVPKRKPREAAKPQEPGRTKDAPLIAPKSAPEPAFPQEPVPEPELALEPESRPAPAPLDAPPLTLREMVVRVDAAWAAFRAAAFGFPSEHMNDHLSEHGWTRKQMLAHIARWHDLTADRLVKLALTGNPAPLELDTDAVNAAAARVAIGKTAGEVLRDVEATFNRLRRQIQRLNDEQLRLGKDWAAQIIVANTYEHYAEHIAELTPPEPPPGSGARR